ncbi:MAG: putative iron-sulfur cluster-binding metallochaperone [Pyrinomonadaceae bacterium]
MVRPNNDDDYRFCSRSDCRTVYFTDQGGQSFKTDDLRVRVGLKEKDGRIPLCYCFGFDEAEVRREITNTGRTTIPQRISVLIKQGMCACPARNPSGSCCLGDVNKTVKRLMGEEIRVP